jgi:hypothetical protein
MRNRTTRTKRGQCSFIHNAMNDVYYIHEVDAFRTSYEYDPTRDSSERKQRRCHVCQKCEVRLVAFDVYRRSVPLYITPNDNDYAHCGGVFGPSMPGGMTWYDCAPIEYFGKCWMRPSMSVNDTHCKVADYLVPQWCGRRMSVFSLFQ